MSVGVIRDAIVTTLQAIPDIGAVQSYERYAKNLTGLAEFYQSHDQVRGWFVRRMRQTKNSKATDRWVVTDFWRITGYMSLDDDAASELVFDGLVQTVCDQFDANDTLDNTVDSCIVNNQAGVQVDDMGPVMFAGVLCHSARLSLATRYYK